MKSNFRRLLFGAAALACATLGWSWSAKAESPQGMRLYAFSSGWLNIDKSALQATAGPGKIAIPVGFFLIHHPKGNVLFDSGDNDKIITDPSYWGPLGGMLTLPNSRDPEQAILKQLDKAGYKASDINYVVLGHMHLDHAGNIDKFPNATIVVQHDELSAAFWPAKVYNCCYIPGDFDFLRWSPTHNATQKILELKGDLDLFGDGSIMIHRQVAHTPGSEMMVVHLPKTGTVVLTSDDLYLMPSLDADILPSTSLTYDPAGMLQGYAFIRALRDTQGAQIFTAHDPDGYRQRKHSPEYYE